jgi:2-phospho-L-lactate guanylyltransferase
VTDGPDGFLVLLPVKATGRGKSRLGLAPTVRRRLALAMASDTAAAAARASRVRGLVALVEDDADGEAIAEASGAAVHRVAARGLNESIREGLALPAVRGPVATIPADLPSLRPDELDDALLLASRHSFAVVADRDGTGTTLLAAAHPELLIPHYGSGSFAAHLAAGAVALPVRPTSGLRRDVDRSDDLAGVTGALTAALLAALPEFTRPDTVSAGCR